MPKKIVASAKRNLSPASSQTVKKVMVCLPPDIVVFFIGGAGDKRPFLGSGPNVNIVEVKKFFDQKFKNEIDRIVISSVYLGYYEVHGDEAVKKISDDFILNKKAKIYIVGHSLGGWNGAHFSEKLSKLGFDVEVLITLDPVGENVYLKAFAEIYAGVPQPQAFIWINLRYNQSYWDVIKKYYPSSQYNNMVIEASANFIADAGQQWWVGPRLDGVATPKRMPDVNAFVNVSHVDTLPAMKYALQSGVTAWSIMETSIKTNLKGEK